MSGYLFTKTKPGIMILIALILFIAAGCIQTYNFEERITQEQKSKTEEGKDMSRDIDSLTTTPPLDRLVPVNLETATFALG